MKTHLYRHLKPVRRRQQEQAALHLAVLGLLAGSLVAIFAAAARFCGLLLPPAAVMAAPAAGLLFGALVGLARRKSWKGAARAVDAHYRLKDRAETALAFSQEPNATPLHRLQVVDAVEHLGQVDVCHAAPLRIPRPLPYALAALCLAVVLCVIPWASQPVEAGPAAPLADVVQQADQLEETMLKDLQEIAKDRDPQLEKLITELKQLVDELKQPGVDHREALAKLSEMQAAIVAAEAEYNLPAVDASLQQLGEALTSAAAMKEASQSLQDGKYDQAAKQLEKLNPKDLSRKEAQTVAEKLKKLAKDMARAKQGQLADATDALCEGLESGNSSQCKSGACKLAGQCRGQSLRKKIGNCLGCQLARLSECKGQCACNCNGQGQCNGQKNGGNGNSLSSSPKNTWGNGTAGDPVGDRATALNGQRQQENITGTPGDGPSEQERSSSPEARQDASRSYRESYDKFRKLSEAVLDSEPLPLGHRQTIRRYFESIRPHDTGGN